MDLWIGLLIAFGVIIFVVVLMQRTLESRFPSMDVDVHDRGMRRRRRYRHIGDAIFKDDIINMVMNRFVYCGRKSDLHYYDVGGKRIYYAFLKNDFLFGYEDEKPSEKHPVLVFKGKKGSVEFDTKEGLLCPFTLRDNVYELESREIVNGQQIASGFIAESAAMDDYIKANNPVMAAIISMLPVAILGAVLALMLYVAYMGLAENSLRIIEIASKMEGCIG